MGSTELTVLGLSLRAFAATAVIAMTMFGADPALAQGHGGGGGDEGEGPLFITMDSFIVSVFDRGAARGRLSLELVLDVPDRANAATVRGQIPRLQNDFLNILSAYLRTRAAITGAPDLDELLVKFQVRADETYGEHIVTLGQHRHTDDVTLSPLALGFTRPAAAIYTYFCRSDSRRPMLRSSESANQRLWRSDSRRPMLRSSESGNQRRSALISAVQIHAACGGDLHF